MLTFSWTSPLALAPSTAATLTPHPAVATTLPTKEAFSEAPPVLQAELQALVELQAANCSATWQWGTSRLGMPPSILPMLSGRAGADGSQLLFVHVGKAGGTSVAKYLSEAAVPFDEVHVHSTSLDVFRNHSTILVSLRDPARRVESAIHEFLEPPADTPHGAEGPSPEVMRCVRSPQMFVRRLNEASLCGDFVRGLLSHPPDTRPLQTLLGNRPFYSPAIAISMFAPNHATFGVCFYLGGLLRELVEQVATGKKRVWVTNVETFDVDLATVLHQLHVDGGRPTIPHERGSNRGRKPFPPLGAEELEQLRGHMAAEYSATAMLRRLGRRTQR